MRKEWKRLTWGGRLRFWYGRGTGRNEVLKPNWYIVAGFFYFILFGVCFSLLRRQVKGWGAMDIRGEWKGLIWGVA